MEESIMNIYKFSLDTQDGVKIIREIMEAEEKPKSYNIYEDYFFSPIKLLKSDIGKITKRHGTEVYMAEDNFEKIKEVYIEYLKDNITLQEEMIEKAQNDLQVLNDNLKGLEQITEQSVENKEQ